MIPIGIVTRNRYRMLDITLRSLSASELPDNQEVIIFDDWSLDRGTLAYMCRPDWVASSIEFPTDAAWTELGLDSVKSNTVAYGIRDKVRIVDLGRPQKGVVGASCAAFLELVHTYGAEHGIIMCQDDVVFNPDWYQRITEMPLRPLATRKNPVGLVCGAWINVGEKRRKDRPWSFVPRGGVTAQCYYITKEGIAAAFPWATRDHNIKQGFDNKFCAAIRNGGCDVYVMTPAVCQHIGIHSSVRPKWGWHQWSKKGRVDFTARGPFPLADTVKKFKP